MDVQALSLQGVLVLGPKVFPDERGYFFESFNARAFRETTGIETVFVQDNQSHSGRHVLRGIHYQVVLRVSDPGSTAPVFGAGQLALCAGSGLPNRGVGRAVEAMRRGTQDRLRSVMRRRRFLTAW